MHLVLRIIEHVPCIKKGQNVSILNSTCLLAMIAMFKDFLLSKKVC